MAAQTVVAMAIIANLALLVSTTVIADSGPACPTSDSNSSISGSTESEQDKECPKNEEYSSCTQSICRAQNCTEKGQSVKCIRLQPEYCLEGCVCKNGYLRAENGTCIPEDQCPLNCEENEVQDDCPANCKSDYCPESENDNKKCSKPDPCPPPACKCRFNYRRDQNGTCIPTRSCPPFDCPNQYEEFDSCPPLCPTDDCSQASPSGECPRLFGRIGTVLQCNPKCRCIKGYWRKNGTCVPYGECPGVCPPNEEYSTCVLAECRALKCTQRGLPIACAAIAEGSCISGCICKENYLQAANGTCIPEDQCSIIADSGPACPTSDSNSSISVSTESEQAGVCPPNEEYSTCVLAECRALKCTQRGLPIACAAIAEGSCISGCICKENYLQAANGTCIPEDQCSTPNCPKNEVYTDSKVSCPPNTCISLVANLNCLADQPVESGCVCASGYLRPNATEPCVPICQCPQMENSPDCINRCTGSL